jgi:hypothetical protein
MLIRFAISVVGLTYAPLEIYLNPILPLKGALISVLAICALINCVCAFNDFSSALTLSYSSALIASTFNSFAALAATSAANFSLVLA